MHVSTWLLATLLVGQVGDTPTPPRLTPADRSSHVAVEVGDPAGRATASEQTANPPRSNARPANPQRATSVQLLADMLTLPTGGTISGQPVSLLSVVVTAAEGPRQFEAIHAYWRVAEAAGNCHTAYDHRQRLARLKAGNDEAPDLRAAQALATAQAGEAELRLTAAENDLAEILLLAPRTPLPLPADLPLVGPYRTLFAELFRGKQAPARARMLDQTLPLRNRAIESHAAALLAAEDAADAAIELQAGGQGRLAGVLAALDAEAQQQRAFLTAVCRYNHDIADYAQVAISPQTTPDLLVGALIKLNRPLGQPVTLLPTTRVTPASYDEPLMAAPAARTAVPNLPARAEQPRYSLQNPVVPSAAPIRVEAPSAGPPLSAKPTTPPDMPQPNPATGKSPDEPGLAPPQESSIPLAPEQAPAAPHQEKPAPHSPSARQFPDLGQLIVRTSQKPVNENKSPQFSASGTPPSSGQGLPYQGSSTSEQAVRLATGLFEASLFARHDLPPTARQPVRLLDCLRNSPVSRRARVVEAYWTTSQMQAQFLALVEEIQHLEALRPALAARTPPSPTAMLRLRADRLAAEADRADHEADWRTAQFELAAISGVRAEAALPQPASLPFLGRIPLTAASSAGPWPQRRLAATLPLWEQAIDRRAAAVAEVDAARAAAAADFLAGRCPVERVLPLIATQARETQLFLQEVTDYNRALGQYAFATLPSNAAPERLAAVLMVE